MEGEASIWYNEDVVVAIIPEKEEMLSVKEIGDILATPLRVAYAITALLAWVLAAASVIVQLAVGDAWALLLVLPAMLSFLARERISHEYRCGGRRCTRSLSYGNAVKGQ